MQCDIYDRISQTQQSKLVLVKKEHNQYVGRETKAKKYD